MNIHHKTESGLFSAYTHTHTHTHTLLLDHLQLSVSTSEYSVLGAVVAGNPALDRTGIPGRTLINYRPKIDIQRPQCRPAVDGLIARAILAFNVHVYV